MDCNATYLVYAEIPSVLDAEAGMRGGLVMFTRIASAAAQPRER